MIKIILKSTYDDMKNQIAQGEAGTLRENREKNRIKKEFEVFKGEHKAEIDIKNKEIGRLAEKIETLTNENSQKNQALELTIKEKEELIIDNSKLEKSIWSCKANRDKISKHLKQAKKELDKVQREKTKLLDTVDAKERVIEEYKNALEQAENKNQLQAAKIDELLKERKHETIEYENDGLPKQTKQSLKAKRKIRKK